MGELAREYIRPQSNLVEVQTPGNHTVNLSAATLLWQGWELLSTG